MILQMLIVGPLMSNCYIVGSEHSKEGIIIDPAAEASVILDAVQRLGLSITLIVATHSHADHIGALGEVKKITGAPFALHESEADGKLVRRFVRELGPVTEAMGLSNEPLPVVEMLLRDGDVVECGDLRFNVRHTPGHSPGGISLLGHGVVFCGDTLFNYSIGRFDLPGGNYDQLMEGILTKLMVLPDDTKVFPGHGPETTIGFERKWNPFLR